MGSAAARKMAKPPVRREMRQAARIDQLISEAAERVPVSVPGGKRLERPAHLARTVQRSVVKASPLEVALHEACAEKEGLIRTEWYRSVANERAMSRFTSEEFEEMLKLSERNSEMAAGLTGKERERDKIWQIKESANRRWDAVRDTAGSGPAGMPAARALDRRINDTGVTRKPDGAGRPRVEYPGHLDRRNALFPSVKISPLEVELHIAAAEDEKRTRGIWYRDSANERALKILGELEVDRIERRVRSEMAKLGRMSDEERREHQKDKRRKQIGKRAALTVSRKA